MFLGLILRHRQWKIIGKPSWDVTCQLVPLMCFVLPHDTLNKGHWLKLGSTIYWACFVGGTGADGTRDSQRKLMNVWQRLSAFHRPTNQYISRRLGCCLVLLSWSSLSSALKFAVFFTELIHQVKVSSWVLLVLWSLVFTIWNGGMITLFCLCEVWNCYIIRSKVSAQWRLGHSL